jgi:hypothetical protein
LKNSENLLVMLLKFNCMMINKVSTIVMHDSGLKYSYSNFVLNQSFQGSKESIKTTV